MTSPIITTDPVRLERHIEKCIVSLRSGSVLDALYMGLFALIFVASGQDLIAMLPGFVAMFLLLVPFCQIWAKVLKRGIHPPHFTFWGNIAFVAAAYTLQIVIWFMAYIGMPFLMCAFAFMALESLGSTVAEITLLAVLIWPIIDITYIYYQRKRLAKLHQEAELASAAARAMSTSE